MLKTCYKCGIEKTEEDFYWNTKEDRHNYMCKECEKERSRLYSKLPERLTRRREIWRKATSLAKENHPEKWEARVLAREAVRKGELRKENCQVCGSKDTQAHHKDYSQPLNVVWLCHKHHVQTHFYSLAT